jgi:DNA-binding NarL/FixJ family response regulator
MTEPRRILLVEDEYMIAQDMAYELKALGADVVGPAPTVERALRLIEEDPAIDTGLLDLNLNGERAYPVAEALLARGARVVFTTGYDEAAIDPRFADVPRCIKLVTRMTLKQMLQPGDG